MVDPVIFIVAERLGRRPSEVAAWPWMEIIGWAAHFNVTAAQADINSRAARNHAKAMGR